MAALDELKSLSLFGPAVAASLPVMATAGVVQSHDQTPAQPMSYSVAGPIGNMSGRPLGQPML